MAFGNYDNRNANTGLGQNISCMYVHIKTHTHTIIYICTVSKGQEGLEKCIIYKFVKIWIIIDDHMFDCISSLQYEAVHFLTILNYPGRIPFLTLYQRHKTRDNPVSFNHGHV